MSPGAVLGGRYEIVEATDHAAFGTLYRATSRSDGATFTIEVLDPRLFGDQRLRAAVHRELATLQGLDHKNLATPLHFADEMLPSGTITFIVMDHLDGQSLADMVEKKKAQGKPFSLKGAYNVIAHLANGLTALSARGSHSGLSMRSVHVTAQGRVKVLELGLARALLAAGARGALAQAVPQLAPEAQSNPEKVGIRTDIYAVGAIFYELLTGTPPAHPAVPASSVVQGLPRSLDVFLDQCLRARMEDRFADLSRLKESLQGAVGPEAGGSAASQSAASQPAASQSAPVLSSAPAPAPARGAPPPPKPPQVKSAPQIPAAPLPPAPKPPVAAAPAPRAPQGPAGVPASFNVGNALSSADDGVERWLIQKDKLDFGPFNLRDVRAQIESGKILGEHTIVDTETGERRRVKDHPQLRELALQAEAAHAESERQRIENADRNKHRGRVVTLLLVIAVVGAVGSIAGYLYVQRMKQKTVVIKEAAEPALNFDIQMKVDPPEKKTGGKRRSGSGKSGNKFDDTQVLGDASEGGGDETLDGPTVQRVMTQNFKVLVGCVQEERHRNPGLRTVDMDFIIKGTGVVSGVKVNGQTTGPFAACMYGKMTSVTFPKFNGSKTHASFSLNLK